MRTKNSIKNVISIIVLNLIIGILGFIKVKVFVNSFSDDIYSLNQLFYQIFSYIVIADMGIGLILNKRLYDSFAKKDHEEINKIYSTSRRFYNFIGIVMIIIALIISFFVHFLTKADISNMYIQIVFIIFIIKNVIDYFFVAPRLVIEADQKNYKINHLIKGIKVIETITEIVLALIGVNYLIILLPGIFITIVMDLYINKLVFKEYPWLKDKSIFDKKYLKGTKDLISLKLAGIMNSNTDIILISTFINPLTVIIYTSYSYITKFVTDTIYIMSSAIVPSFANALCEEKTNKTYGIFEELNILFLLLACFISVMFYTFLNPLITLWLGEKYLITNFALFLFCVIVFQNIASRAVIMTINSKALFPETKKATIIEAIINFILSIILVQKLGLIGVLLGTIISYFCTSFIQNSVYIYKNIFNKFFGSYFGKYFIVSLITILIGLILNQFHFAINNVITFILLVLIIAIILIIILWFIFHVLFSSFRDLEKRGYKIILEKRKEII